jgi:hypothetical protein
MLRIKLAILAILVAAPALAETEQELMCAVLWHQRNAILKDAGYCFKSPQGIRIFGNAGCRYHTVEELPLSDIQRAALLMYAQEEQAQKCPRR